MWDDWYSFLDFGWRLNFGVKMIASVQIPRTFQHIFDVHVKSWCKSRFQRIISANIESTLQFYFHNFILVRSVNKQYVPGSLRIQYNSAYDKKQNGEETHKRSTHIWKNSWNSIGVVKYDIIAVSLGLCQASWISKSFSQFEQREDYDGNRQA